MIFAHRPNRLYLTFALVALSLLSAESAAAKCARQLIQMPGLEPGDGVILVDGAIVQVGLQVGVEEGQSALDRLDPAVIHSIEITCWNPKTGEIGGGAGIPVIEILTKHLMESPGAPSEADVRAKGGRAIQELFEARERLWPPESTPANPAFKELETIRDPETTDGTANTLGRRV